MSYSILPVLLPGSRYAGVVRRLREVVAFLELPRVVEWDALVILGRLISAGVRVGECEVAASVLRVARVRGFKVSGRLYDVINCDRGSMFKALYRITSMYNCLDPDPPGTLQPLHVRVESEVEEVCLAYGLGLEVRELSLSIARSLLENIANVGVKLNSKTLAHTAVSIASWILRGRLPQVTPNGFKNIRRKLSKYMVLEVEA